MGVVGHIKTLLLRTWRCWYLGVTGALAFVLALSFNEAIKAEVKSEGANPWTTALNVTAVAIGATMVLTFLDRIMRGLLDARVPGVFSMSNWDEKVLDVGVRRSRTTITKEMRGAN